MELKIRHADATAVTLSEYVSVWRRMIIRCEKHEADKAKADAEVDLKRRAEYAKVITEQARAIQELAGKLRPVARDQLIGKLDMVTLYFSESLGRRVAEFKVWDEAQQTRTCADLPSLHDFRSHQQALLTQLKAEVTP